MRISTKMPQEPKNGKGKPPARRSSPVRQKSSQKIGKSRITSRSILSTVRKFGKLGGILIIAAVVFSLCMYVYNSDKLQVQNIAIYGCREIDPVKLEQIIRGNIPDNILHIELNLLKEQLEQEKWIRNVEIRRVLPFGLVIYVQERNPSVILEMNGDLMLADNDGILLDVYTSQYGKLDVPVFKGVVGKDEANYRTYQEENTARIRHALNMLAEIESESTEYSQKISEIDISDRNNLKIMLVDDTVEIYLGKEDYLKRLKTFFTNKEKYEATKKKYGDIVVVDLRLDTQIRYERNINVSGSSRR